MSTLLAASTCTDVTAERMRIWADILADPNPIHLDGELVRRMGLGPDVINQGPLNIAYVLNAVTAALPGAVLEHYSARMLGNVFAGDRLTVTATIVSDENLSPAVIEAELVAEGRGPVVSMELRLRTQAGS